MLNLAHRVERLNHTIHLNQEFKADLDWWKQFLPLWNGSATFIDSGWVSADKLLLSTDASASIGCGAIYGTKWFNFRWPDWVLKLNPPIAWYELVPIYFSCMVWGDEWFSKRIEFRSDNQTTVAVWKKFSSPHRGLMELIRRIYFYAAKGNFTLRISYIAGVENIVADALSRFQMERFRYLVPDASGSPVSIDSNLVELKRSLLQPQDSEMCSSTIESADCYVPTWLQALEELTEQEFEGSHLFA